MYSVYSLPKYKDKSSERQLKFTKTAVQPRWNLLSPALGIFSYFCFIKDVDKHHSLGNLHNVAFFLSAICFDKI